MKRPNRDEESGTRDELALRRVDSCGAGRLGPGSLARDRAVREVARGLEHLAQGGEPGRS